MAKKVKGGGIINEMANRHYEVAQPIAYGGRMLCAECFDGKHNYCRQKGCTCHCHEALERQKRKADDGAQLAIMDGRLPINARKE